MPLSRIRPNLYVTDIETVQTTALSDHGISAVITVCQNSTEPNVGCRYHQFSIPDWRHDYDQFKAAVDTLRDVWLQDKTALVHCHKGQSRSVSVAAAGLAVIENTTLDASYNAIAAHREIHPSPPLRESAEQYITENRVTPTR